MAEECKKDRGSAAPTDEMGSGAANLRPGQPCEDESDPITEAMAFLASDFDRYYLALQDALEPQKAYLSETEYDLYRRGKKIRPLLLIMCARMVFVGGRDDQLPSKVIKAAASTEMLHVATLIHDDIVDHAPVRRGLETVHSARGTETAILVGDLQFVQAIRCFARAIDTDRDMNLVHTVLDTAFNICCGELDEIQTDPNWETEKLKERYLETIERKTAVLFGLACECGTALGGGRTRDARRAGFFGRRIGRAFQIMDDIFDIGQSARDAGKAKGADVSQRRLSLPIIYAMDEYGPDHIISRIMRGADYSDESLAEAIAAVRQSDGFIRAYQDARQQVLEALDYLEVFPKNACRDHLEKIAYHVVDRGYL